jgi:uncharacterized protein YjbI with pentapeptide repeats
MNLANIVYDMELDDLDNNITLNDLSNIDLSDLSDIDLSDLSDIDLSDLSDIDLSDLSNIDLSDLNNIDLSDLNNIDLSDLNNIDLSDLNNIDLSNMDLSDLNNIDLGIINLEIEKFTSGKFSINVINSEKNNKTNPPNIYELQKDNLKQMIQVEKLKLDTEKLNVKLIEILNYTINYCNFNNVKLNNTIDEIIDLF